MIVTASPYGLLSLRVTMVLVSPAEVTCLPEVTGFSRSLPDPDRTLTLHCWRGTCACTNTHPCVPQTTPQTPSIAHPTRPNGGNMLRNAWSGSQSQALTQSPMRWPPRRRVFLCDHASTMCYHKRRQCLEQFRDQHLAERGGIHVVSHCSHSSISQGWLCLGKDFTVTGRSMSITSHKICRPANPLLVSRVAKMDLSFKALDSLSEE
jgi:hypothetical protein